MLTRFITASTLSIVGLTLAASQVRSNQNPNSGLQLKPRQFAELESRAKAGDAEAELKVARAYATGEGVPQDTELAAKWYRMAAEQGNAAAQYNLGLAYMNGEGVDRDKSQAVNWYQKSARQNYANAMYNLGTAYYNGDGVDINDATAYAWFVLAKQEGNKNAVDAVQRAEGELKPEMLVQGMKEIAKFYEKGEVLQRNEALAAQWWLKTAEKGNQDARIAIASRYLDGRGVPQDFTQAKNWCTEVVKESEASKDPDNRGYYCIGYIYEHGPAADRDLKKAREWYERAMFLRSAQAVQALARMYASGDGGKLDRPGAWLLYFELAQSKDKSAVPHLTELKKEMSQKEWDTVMKRLALLRIDPKQVAAFLADSPAAK